MKPGRCRIPYAIPHIFSGLRVSITLAIIGAVVAEFVAAEEGLGYFIQFSTSFFKIPQAFAGLIFCRLSVCYCLNRSSGFRRGFFRGASPRRNKIETDMTLNTKDTDFLRQSFCPCRRSKAPRHSPFCSDLGRRRRQCTDDAG